MYNLKEARIILSYIGFVNASLNLLNGIFYTFKFDNNTYEIFLHVDYIKMYKKINDNNIISIFIADDDKTLKEYMYNEFKYILREKKISKLLKHE